MPIEKSYHICDARPTGGKAGKGYNKTSTVQVFDDTNPFCVFLVKVFRFNVNDFQSHKEAKAKASAYVKTLLTLAGADAPGALEAKQDSPADAPLDSARGSRPDVRRLRRKRKAPRVRG